MLGRILEETGRAAARIAAHLAHPVVVAYRELYSDDDGSRLLHDPRSTVFGQFDAASNRDHTTDEVFAFGFGREQRRATHAGTGD